VEGSQLAGLTILVVEDEPLVALEIADALTARGAHVVAASRVADAVSSIALHRIDAAVLDINLGGEDCSVLCQHLSQRHIPFVFYTGYATALEGWNNVPMIAKPAHGTHIVDVVERLWASKHAA
jgi:DNA-binding response OmpR family regulator